ncbi:alpha/beta hydrolase [Haloechinothrix sp. LS1_15]|uniref:alpha/beta fold hydrolase n=1 Tax=Haloechinothrix sp. LS1_15 TaxID=2652248 RepID=UPI002947D400|nr:alpha/beta hydrolase [Haloechinothrix sp. LS1_15]MDV6013631.1 alpha/beta hydrolase [Haloechinothrix sp. LS1_15]
MARTGKQAVAEWHSGGQWVTVPQGRVFVRATEGTEGRGPRLVFLHGYPSSGYDFRGVLDRLAGRATLTLDFPGFGLSDKPRPHGYTLFEHADVVEWVLARYSEEPVYLVAHDMGTSVATELMARDRDGELGFDLSGVVLSNGGIIIERASLRPAQRALLSPLGPLVARLTNRPMFVRQFGRLFSAEHPLGRTEAEAQWALLARQNGHRILHLLCRYVRERAVYAHRWHGAIRHWDQPVSFLWGLQDPVATTDVLAGLRQLRPSAPVVELPELGHYPQIEAPEVVAEAVLWLIGHPEG